MIRVLRLPRPRPIPALPPPHPHQHGLNNSTRRASTREGKLTSATTGRIRRDPPIERRPGGRQEQPQGLEDVPAPLGAEPQPLRRAGSEAVSPRAW